jgi:hypothetical protein
MSDTGLLEINVTDIGDYLRHRSCDRRFWLKFYDDRGKVRPHFPFFDALLDTLDPVLREVGLEREKQWKAELQSNGFIDITEMLPKGKHKEVQWEDFAGKLAALPADEPAYGGQVKVTGEIGLSRKAQPAATSLIRPR